MPKVPGSLFSLHASGRVGGHRRGRRQPAVTPPQVELVLLQGGNQAGLSHDRYPFWGHGYTQTATEAQAQFLPGVAGTLGNFQVRTYNFYAKSWKLTIRLNGLDTTILVTCPATVGYHVLTDTVHTAGIGAATLLSARFTDVDSGALAGPTTFCLTLTPS